MPPPSDPPLTSPERSSSRLVQPSSPSIPVNWRALPSISQLRSHTSLDADHDGPDTLRRVASNNRLRYNLQDEARSGRRLGNGSAGHRESVYDWAPSLPGVDHISEDLEGRTLPPIQQQSPDSRNYALLELPPSLRAHALSSARVGGFREALPPLDASHYGFSISHARPRRSERGRDGRDRDNRLRLELGETDALPRLRSIRTRSGHTRDSSPRPSHDIESAIKFLSSIRTASSHDESIRLALHASPSKGDEWMQMLDETSKGDDLLLDTKDLGCPESSWLRVGAVFTGNQSSPGPSSSARSARLRMHIPTTDDSSSATASSSRDRTRSENAGSSPTKWDVRVSISSIDHARMCLTGTMEAIATPSCSSITTYLEGEIIDFNQHTFHTTTIKSSLKDDAANWKKLKPFSDMSNETFARSLLSRKFMHALCENWVFLRWKERCFLETHSSSDLGGLTIGGFYYLSMRRFDGSIQGYYYDPASQPDQELLLKPPEHEMMGCPPRRRFPVYQFR